jgi:hypothetical protein
VKPKSDVSLCFLSERKDLMEVLDGLDELFHVMYLVYGASTAPSKSSAQYPESGYAMRQAG